jgi:glyoxylase-like metal-dependent hydrolase (beta-lactamase superfamily II)
LDQLPLDRRTFLAELGRGAFAVAVVGLAGCAPALTSRPSTGAARASEPARSGSAGPSESAAGASAGANRSPSGGGGSSPSGGGSVSWERVNLGVVSAYVLVRGGEAAIVDTGVANSVGAIEQALTSLSLDWSAVAHLILTHHHGDHVGSAADVLTRAPDAAGYAGAEDIPKITVPKPLKAVGDGDRVFDLEVITAPGHTAGSICVFDRSGGILVAGDAMRTEGGRPARPGAQFTEDMDQAVASIAKLSKLTFETLLVGHGDPIESRASRLVAELAASTS